MMAFITKYHETKKILKHIGEETIRPPPLKPSKPTNKTDMDAFSGDFIPSVDDYIRDPESAY